MTTRVPQLALADVLSCKVDRATWARVGDGVLQSLITAVVRTSS